MILLYCIVVVKWINISNRRMYDMRINLHFLIIIILMIMLLYFRKNAKSTLHNHLFWLWGWNKMDLGRWWWRKRWNSHDCVWRNQWRKSLTLVWLSVFEELLRTTMYNVEYYYFLELLFVLCMFLKNLYFRLIICFYQT